MMAKVYTSSKPFKIGQVADILKEAIKNPDIASKNVQLFKLKGGTGYVYFAENSAKRLNWKSDLYRFGKFLKNILP